MKILVTGSNGMLGSDLVRELLAQSYEVCGLGKSPNRHSRISYVQADITNRQSVLESVSRLKPAIVIHAAAFTDVDGCEEDSDRAFSVNTEGTKHVVEASNACGAPLFLISTDYVFDGEKKGLYRENDTPKPISVYGRSKYEAEEFLKSHCRSGWIIRSSWLYGENGKNFFRTILQTATKTRKLRVVNDQRGAPTYTKDLAKGLRMLVEKSNRISGCRVYHLANTGTTTWFDAARKVVSQAGWPVEVEAISSQDLKRPAKRPMNCAFDMSKIKTDFNIELRSWEEAFADYWTESLEKESHVLIASKPSAQAEGKKG